MAKKPKIALVHDFLREYGGAERVLEALHQLYPEAPVYVAFYDPNSLGMHAQRFSDWDIRQTWFAKIPGHRKLFSPLRFLAPRAFADLDLSAYDVVISSANAFHAKAVKVPNGKHLCYCHTPPRSLYGYSTMSGWKRNRLLAFFGAIINHYLRVVDFNTAQAVDIFIANSKETQQRISAFYDRESTVVYPPVEMPTLAEQKKLKPLAERDYYFYLNRLGLQKHPELAVQAANKLGVPLKVAGKGPLLEDLRAMAGPTVQVLGGVDDAELKQLYAGAKALLYPVEDEDFGIIPVEAMSYGVPVLAHRSGGPRETVIDGKTGVFFDELTVLGLIEAIHLANAQQFSAISIAQHARTYATEQFEDQIKQLVKSVTEQA